MAVIIPGDLFGFTAEFEIAFSILDRNKVIQARKLKKEMGGQRGNNKEKEGEAA